MGGERLDISRKWPIRRHSETPLDFRIMTVQSVLSITFLQIHPISRESAQNLRLLCTFWRDQASRGRNGSSS
jgi:hypothetical protein